jgi:general secretion pathway protein E
MTPGQVRDRLSALPAADPDLAVKVVDLILEAGRAARASDLHFRPTQSAFEIAWRVDGVLQPVAQCPVELAPRITARLKVLAGLLSYRTDVPQEGRLRATNSSSQRDIGETRVSTFPCLFGEKTVVRLAVGAGPLGQLADLGLPPEMVARLGRALEQTTGLVLVTGPAGSGKSTTIYACLREIADKSGGSRNLVSVEDPVEVVLPSVTQSQVNPAQGFTLASGLKALLRQDPDVILVGEIRDRDTAEAAFQAALTGHLVLSTFHAGSAAQAVGRLCDLSIEPYVLRSGLAAVVSQRLLRRACSACAAGSVSSSHPGTSGPVPSEVQDVSTTNCAVCGGTGYHGRFPVAEWLDPDTETVGQLILKRATAAEIEQAARTAGMITLRQRAEAAVQSGQTTREELFRVLGHP